MSGFRRKASNTPRKRSVAGAKARSPKAHRGGSAQWAWYHERPRRIFPWWNCGGYGRAGTGRQAPSGSDSVSLSKRPLAGSGGIFPRPVGSTKGSCPPRPYWQGINRRLSWGCSLRLKTSRSRHHESAVTQHTAAFAAASAARKQP